MEFGSGRIVAALGLGALLLIAALYVSENASDVVMETAPQTSTDLPETVDSFLQMAVTKGKAAKKVAHKMSAFSTYQVAKAKAVAKGCPKGKCSPKFKTAEHICSVLRTSSYKKCGKSYCTAKKACGKPCQKLFAQPPLQVVPLSRGMGSKFYKVEEVTHKENGAKLKRAREREDKARAAAERRAKEVQYKAEMRAEKAAKALKRKELNAKEVAKKERDAKARKRNELQNKAKEMEAKQSILLKCQAKADAEEHYCEVVMEKKDDVAAVKAARAAVLAAHTAAAAANHSAMAQKPNSTIDAVAAAHAANKTMHAAVAARIAAIKLKAKAGSHSGAVQETNHTAEWAADMKSKFDGIEKNYTDGLAKLPSPLPKEIIEAAQDAEAMAKEFIPVELPKSNATNARRLLAMNGTDVTDATAEAAEANPAKAATDLAKKPEKHIPTPEEVKAMEASVAADKKQLAEDHHKAALAMNATGKGEQETDTATGKLNLDHDKEKSQDNAAREDAGYAALAEARVKLIDSFVKDHRGALHKTNCTVWKKFGFDVCMGRDVYKRQIVMTKKSVTARTEATKLKADMAKDYAAVLEKNKTLHDLQKAATATGNAVLATRKKLNEDAEALALAKAKVLAEQNRLARQEKHEKKKKEEEEVAKAMAAAESGGADAAAPAAAAADANATALEADVLAELIQEEEMMDSDFVEEEPEDAFVEEPHTGRRLLDDDSDPQPDSNTCTKATDKAFDECEADVDKAYETCSKQFDRT